MLEINLLPWREQKRVVNNNIFYLYSILLVIFIIIFGYILIINNNRVQVTTNLHSYNLEQQIAALNNTINTSKNKLQQQELLQQQTVIIKNITMARNAKLQILIDLLQNTPEAICYTVLQIMTAEIVIEGIASNNLALTTFINNLAQLSWCAAVDLVSVSAKKFKLHINKC
ncbi:MAG: hypothetical protein COB50_02920 [Thiotrichales bacterium]|nr:MAG: hypothetical protein COB50_02920 [Thiotrichales bacterium]